jgi:hypothetical protein
MTQFISDRLSVRAQRSIGNRLMEVLACLRSAEPAAGVEQQIRKLGFVRQWDLSGKACVAPGEGRLQSVSSCYFHEPQFVHAAFTLYGQIYVERRF